MGMVAKWQGHIKTIKKGHKKYCMHGVQVRKHCPCIFYGVEQESAAVR